MLMAAAACGRRPYIAIWCEHHEDFLAERNDQRFDGYQIKTSRPESGVWTLKDGEFTKSIGRFVELVTTFGDRIENLYFVSNKDFDDVASDIKDYKRRARCPRQFLNHIRNCSSRADIAPPFDEAFNELQAACGCEAEQLIATLKRMDLINGPSRGEFDAALSHEHLAQLDICRNYNAEQLDKYRDELVAIVHRASSLQITDPIRHLRSLIDAKETDPALVAKRVGIAETIVDRDLSRRRPDFQFQGDPKLQIGSGLKEGIIEQKFLAADLEDQIDYIKDRARAAEYSLLEQSARNPDTFPQILRQIEQRVHGELSEAYLRARQRPTPYGPVMLIDAQDRLRRLAETRPEDVSNHGAECLIGIAGLLTNECRVWWGPRFPIKGG